MPSAWHRDDDREYGEAPLLLACDGCGRDVRLVAEDWRDNDGHWCVACVLRAVSHAHDADQWPDVA